MGSRLHFDEVQFGSGRVTLLFFFFFGLKVKMLTKELEILYKIFYKLGLVLKVLFSFFGQ